MKGTALFLAVVFVMPRALADNKKETERVENAGKEMSEILRIPDDIPQDLLDKAECVVVLPSVVKAAFIVGANYGRGGDDLPQWCQIRWALGCADDDGIGRSLGSASGGWRMPNPPRMTSLSLVAKCKGVRLPNASRFDTVISLNP